MRKGFVPELSTGDTPMATAQQIPALGGDRGMDIPRVRRINPTMVITPLTEKSSGWG